MTLSLMWTSQRQGERAWQEQVLLSKLMRISRYGNFSLPTCYADVASMT